MATIRQTLDKTARDLNRAKRDLGKTTRDLGKTTQDLSKATQDVGRIAQEAAYVAIGLGVIGFQRAQVRRREIAGAVERAARDGLGSPSWVSRNELARRVQDIDESLGQLIEAMDSRFEPVEHRLPPTAQTVVRQAKDARDQLRTRIVRLAA